MIARLHIGLSKLLLFSAPFLLSGCLYLGEIEAIQQVSPLEIFMSYPEEGEVMRLDQNPNTNKAFVYVYYSDSLNNIDFRWRIGPNILSSEYIPPDGVAVGSEVNIPEPDPSWNGQNLFVFVFDSGSSVSRSWPIEVIEGNE
ncbi:MAG: hypothetical protein CL916_15340 [Deltaproteobacteria bacterium]|nr:hypothetical protein [Deltaproteobacteria bacterium]